MALEPDFLTMTQDTVTVAEPSTFSKYGGPTYGSASTAIPAYVEYYTRKVVDSRGIEVVASGTVFLLSTSVSVGPHAKITLPNGKTPEILRVDINNDDEGQHHVEVVFR